MYVYPTRVEPSNFVLFFLKEKIETGFIKKTHENDKSPATVPNTKNEGPGALSSPPSSYDEKIMLRKPLN